ncbi:MAG: hypothetical protein ACI4PO_03185 [Faecousia sp.]
MKKALGWILVILGGFFCFDCVVCASVAFTVGDATLAERTAALVSCIALAAVNGLLCWLGFKLKAKKPKSPMPAGKAPASEAGPGKKEGKTARTALTEKWMTSQLPAMYLQESKPAYRDHYVGYLESIGFTKKDAEKMFDFECGVIRKYPKQYLLQPQFTKMWFFGLKQPFFRQYPKTKEDILKERYLTVSELCKLIDEAEWHFWNSHERELPDSVWQEICEWRLGGPGAEFAVRYFQMIEEATGIPEDSLAKLSSEQGRHLSRYKWG